MSLAARLWTLKIVLGPVLLMQGWWVRKRTVVLPEPVTQQSGTSGSGKPLRLLLIGDSSAAGVGSDNAEESLLGQLVSVMSADHQVHYRMMAKTGRTTQDMLNTLKAAQADSFDVVVSALGVNDVTAQVPVKRWVDQQQQLIECLRNQFSARLIILSGLPPMRDFPALPWPLNAYLGACADRLNKALEELCADQQDICFHSLREYPETATAATDGFHPGPTVYHHWARFLATIIKSRSDGSKD